MNEVAIQCKGIKKCYGKDETRIEALKGIDLDLHAGELTLLCGPSGSGKTTLLSIITSILTPDDGELLVLGKDIHNLTPDEKAKFCSEHIGIVFQSLFLIPSLTVKENIALPLLVAGNSEEEADKKADDLLKKLHIEKYAMTSPANMSKGQQQRVAIARALIHDPSIILCDEPTSALDHATGMQIMTILHELAKEAQKAILVVTHDHRIFEFADRIVNMEDGQIIPEAK